MPFKNRQEAAEKLADILSEHYQGSNPLVLGIPRGGVIMADIIARSLGGEMDIVLVRKLRDPYQEEVAIGSVDESGSVHLNRHGERLAEDAYLEEEISRQIEVLRDRRRQYTPVRPPIEPKGRNVIIVDDGLATGSTMLAALQAVRKRDPSELCAAAAVAPPDTVASVEEKADRVVCLETPGMFMAVGQFFMDFDQVPDEEAVRILKKWG